MRYLIVLTLAGCATQWHHESKTEQQMHEDAFRCERVAATQINPGERDQMFDRCMYAHGWRR